MLFPTEDLIFSNCYHRTDPKGCLCESFIPLLKQDHFSFQDLYRLTKMDPLYTPLYKAVRSGNIQDVKALISSGVEIDAKGKNPRNATF